jgi:glucan phosphoethanolaminetransferase (alkaline phosphatase superfamily)
LSGSLMVLEVNWRSLTLLLLASLLLVNFTLWLYGFLAFKLNLTADYESIVVFIKSFPAEFFYNWLLLYPMYLLSNLLKRLIDNLKLRRRGFVS